MNVDDLLDLVSTYTGQRPRRRDWVGDEDAEQLCSMTFDRVEVAARLIVSGGVHMKPPPDDAAVERSLFPQWWRVVAEAVPDWWIRPRSSSGLHVSFVSPPIPLKPPDPAHGQRPVDADLARKIGTVQNYGDDT